MNLNKDSKVLKVASDCAWVAENAEHVKINEAKIPEYIKFILEKYKAQAMPELFSPEHHYIVHNNKEATLLYTMAIDSINFASGYFQIAKNDYDVDINYYAIADFLKNAFENDAINTPEKWVNVTADELFKFFPAEQDKYPKIDEMVEQFAEALRDSGEHLINEYKGSVCNLIEACDFSAVKIADTLAEWKFFKDVSEYKGRDIHFLKRAQILPADIDLVYRPYLKDIHELTIFADNVVPHTLYCDGILEYSDSLKNKINNRSIIQSGNAEEVEMRACSIHAVELMKQYLHETGRDNVRSVDIDRLLWHRGEDEKDINSLPTHITETSFY